MRSRWILVADGSRARILVTDRELRSVEERARFAHPETRMPERELRTDAPGRYSQSPGNLPSSAFEERDLHREERGVFARELVAELTRAVDDRELAELVLVAPPGMLGDLRPLLPPRVASKVVGSVEKDYAGLSLPELIERLRSI